MMCNQINTRDALSTVLAQTVVARYKTLCPKAQEGLVYIMARKVGLGLSSPDMKEWIAQLKGEMES